jgi:hypothetical protein
MKDEIVKKKRDQNNPIEKKWKKKYKDQFSIIKC